MKRILCKACTIRNQRPSPHCHECKGLGYIEVVVIPPNCTGEQPECPVFFEPMCGGWKCERCGRSGPL